MKYGEKRILTVDGHTSHQITKILFKFHFNNIYIILITCSYHILQTLNAIVFGLVKKASRKELNKLAVINDSTQLGKTLFIKCYYKADIASFTLNFFITGLKAPRLWTISNATLFENAMMTKLEVLSITPPG